MKAATRHAWIVLAASVALAAVLSRPVLAETAPWPERVAHLPALGERMQRDPRSGLALHGFDPVAYFATGQAVPGRSDYEVTLNGFAWRFATAANRDAFRDAPEAYMPRFSGFDATAVADGRAVESDPLRFAIVDAQLYFFRTQDSRERFLHEADLRTRSEENWPKVSRQIAR